jgi:hypothetical protein
MRGAPPAWFASFFPILFLGFWVVVSFLLSIIGGWMTIARSYPVQQDFGGEEFWWRSGRIGWVNYGSCLNLVASSHGLRVSVSLPFRLAHPPFFVPWAEVHSEHSRRLFFRVVRLRFARAPEATLEISHRLAVRLAAASNSAFQLPGDAR